MDKPLRILAIVNLPWEPRLGGARVYVDLADKWRAAGHSVEKFCVTDAFPRTTKSHPLSVLRQALFPNRAARFVRQNASRFDVIDALIGTLPFSKSDLGFTGLLVARSVGLHRSYRRFDRVSRERWPDQPRGKFVGRLFYGLTSRLFYRNAERALRCCDLINLNNEDEISFLQDAPTIQTPFIVQPNGLTDAERANLAGATQPAEIRLEQKKICFIGMWGLRKGSRDWPEIVHRVGSEIPGVQFNFFGTMVDEQTVLKELNASSADRMRIVQTFERQQLSSLLSSCSLGLFPTYIEGLPLAMLEQLAAGIPVVAYDVPGPRQILKPLRHTLLVPEGDPIAMANCAGEILRMNADDYSALSAQCRSIASQFSWEKIAADTAEQYHSALRNLPPSG